MKHVKLKMSYGTRAAEKDNMKDLQRYFKVDPRPYGRKRREASAENGTEYQDSKDRPVHRSTGLVTSQTISHNLKQLDQGNATTVTAHMVMCKRMHNILNAG